MVGSCVSAIAELLLSVELLEHPVKAIRAHKSVQRGHKKREEGVMFRASPKESPV